MRVKDLRPGMAVALKTSTYAPYAVPAKHVVLTLDYTVTDRYALRGELITLNVTSEDGEQISVSSKNIRALVPNEKTPAHVLLAHQASRDGTWVMQSATPSQIEGPYAEVAAQREEARARHEAAQRQTQERKVAAERRQHKVYAALLDLGVKTRLARDTGYLMMPMDDAEDLIERLREEQG